MSHQKAILVVDNCRDTADSLSTLLWMWGYHPVPAYDGFEAIKFAQQNRLIAALIDIGMPGMDGYQVAYELRTKVDLDGMLLLAITGYGSQEDIERSMKAGFHRHLIKPVDPIILKQILDLHAMICPGDNENVITPHNQSPHNQSPHNQSRGLPHRVASSTIFSASGWTGST